MLWVYQSGGQCDGLVWGEADIKMISIQVTDEIQVLGPKLG